MQTVPIDTPVCAGRPPDMPAVRRGSDPNGVVQNASHGFRGAARQALANTGKTNELEWRRFARPEMDGIQSPKRARREVSKVRTVPANPFESTENSAPGMGVSLVRKGGVWRRGRDCGRPFSGM